MNIITKKFYRLLKNVACNDGFQIKKGETGLFLAEDDGYINLLFEDDNSKRFLWVSDQDVEIAGTISRRTSKTVIDEHFIDINEKWLDNEQSQTSQSGTATIKSRSVKNNRSKTKRKGVKLNSAKRSRNRNLTKTGKKRKATTTKRKNTK